MIKGGRLSASIVMMVGVMLALAAVAGSAQVVTTTQISTNVTIQQTQYGAIDWTNGLITIEVSGVGDASKPIAQRKLMARRAATLAGYRDLLETTRGVLIESETLMRDFMVVNDDVRAAATGVVNGAVVVPGSEVYTEEADGSITCTLKMQMYLRDLLVPVYATMRSQFGTAAVTTMTTSPYTGLIIDVAGFPFPKPAVFRVITVSGTVVYGVQVANYDYACASRLASYINSVIAAKQNLADRVGGNPYVIRAIRVNQTDIIVPDDVIAVTRNMGPVLQQCKVVVSF